MTLPAACGVLSTVLAVYCGVPYVRSILAGGTRPHQFSWLIFTVMNAVVTVSQLLEGGTYSVLISATFFLGSALNFVLSLKYGRRGTSRFDVFLFSFSLLTILAWILTRSNGVAIWLTVVIDLCATSMILLKVRADPSSEAAWPWAVGTVAYVFSCAALSGTGTSLLWVRPVYGLLTDALIVAFIWRWTRTRARP